MKLNTQILCNKVDNEKNSSLLCLQNMGRFTQYNVVPCTGNYISAFCMNSNCQLRFSMPQSQVKFNFLEVLYDDSCFEEGGVTT